MIYIDSSCLLKAIRIEPGSEAVSKAIENEAQVIVSSLAELEALIELKAGHKAGDYSRDRWHRLEASLSLLRNREPYSFRPVRAEIWSAAFRQHRNSGDTHCRTLDRLHLAAAEKFGIARLMTHDAGQAKAAEELGMEVVWPGR